MDSLPAATTYFTLRDGAQRDEWDTYELFRPGSVAAVKLKIQTQREEGKWPEAAATASLTLDNISEPVLISNLQACVSAEFTTAVANEVPVDSGSNGGGVQFSGVFSNKIFSLINIQNR